MLPQIERARVFYCYLLSCFVYLPNLYTKSWLSIVLFHLDLSQKVL